MNEYSESVVNAKVFANKFRQLCKDFVPPYKTVHKHLTYRRVEYNKEIVNFLAQVKMSMLRERCHRKTFKEEIIKINNYFFLNLEIWWYLMKCHILTSEDMLLIFSDENYCSITEHVASNLFNYLFVETVSDSNLKRNLNSDFIELFLRHKSDCDLNGKQCFMYKNLCDCVSNHISSISGSSKKLNMSTLLDALKTPSMPRFPRKIFILDLLEILLHGSSMSVEDTINKTEILMQEEQSHNFDLVTFLDLDDVIMFLTQILKKFSTSLDWSNLFCLLNTLTSYYEEFSTAKKLKELIRTTVEEALNTFNKDLLLSLFVIVRYYSSRRINHFPNYLQWFSLTFSSESSRPINTKEKALFFVNFLNETILFDAPYYLKVHINRVPCVPMEHQSLISDYVKLVKTRLIDLNESTEMGLFDNITSKPSPEFDVKIVIDIFGNTNEIPTCVLEASLFCKIYYEKKFLVTLLSKFEGKNSNRHKLITKLQSIGKIPNSLFLQYKQLM